MSSLEKLSIGAPTSLFESTSARAAASASVTCWACESWQFAVVPIADLASPSGEARSAIG